MKSWELNLAFSDQSYYVLQLFGNYLQAYCNESTWSCRKCSFCEKVFKKLAEIDHTILQSCAHTEMW